MRWRTRIALSIVVMLSLSLLAIALIPASNLATRTSAVILAPALWIGLVFLAWPRLALRFALVLIGALTIIALVGPGRAYSTVDLRMRLCRELSCYDGTRYVWGGENALGIDCSGLVRCGLIRAAVKQGIATANPRLVRLGVSLWWRDCTARELGEGRDGSTVPVLQAESINAIDAKTLQSGDLAVTANGLHVLNYIGDDTWIEADPIAERVLIVRVPERQNPWFDVPIRIVRWRALSNTR